MSRITLTSAAREALRDGEVVFFDWHVTGLCCADAGEFSVRAVRRARLPRRARPLGRSGLVYAHPTAWVHLTGLPVTVDCRPLWRWRRFVSDLPPDAGLRCCLGRPIDGSLQGR
ncbi:hypothetical protein BKM31_41685 [[Actinomadura] parvosata subsp. kistnae]|uniref:Uncharacterized protein n=1 Tax=[Actinomadura] parvosata subsp. kistnae TaxID=1909395 RepID=A0A1V0AA70_9ACTN|nr:hypothetical protein [Nonomuraea sp. ATCC 55076]AQZ67106.1 hypothetical protein BKM31_41685 [Nonomuraea sp. ATCC 55076]